MVVKRFTLWNALQIAAMQYRKDAELFRLTEGAQDIVARFQEQARLADELADAVEQATSLNLAD